MAHVEIGLFSYILIRKTSLSGRHFVCFPKSVISYTHTPDLGVSGYDQCSLDRYFKVTFVNWGGETRVFHSLCFVSAC